MLSNKPMCVSDKISRLKEQIKSDNLEQIAETPFRGDCWATKSEAISSKYLNNHN